MTELRLDLPACRHYVLQRESKAHSYAFKNDIIGKMD
jgi:hypothetical protein